MAPSAFTTPISSKSVLTIPTHSRVATATAVHKPQNTTLKAKDLLAPIPDDRVRVEVPARLSEDDETLRTDHAIEAAIDTDSVSCSNTAGPASSHLENFHKEHNSVTIKHDTKVKDAAGAIFKVLSRLSTVFINALRLDVRQEGLNRAVKAITVARKYMQDEGNGFEISFLPFNRSDPDGTLNPQLFAFLAFKSVISEPLKSHDDTDLNVSGSSDANKMANAIMSIILDRGQAVMKAGGCEAIYVAMTAIVNARRRLKSKHLMDVMLLSAFITEDTTQSLGRESKFIKFNILKCAMNGPITSPWLVQTALAT